MIDINELRRLAQAATPGPWWVNQDSLNHGFECGVLEINAKDWHALAGAWGVTGAKPSEEGAANAAFIAAANPEVMIELLDRLEAAETAWKVSDKSCYGLTEKVIPNLRDQLESAEKERDALQAKIEAMEQQEPYSYIYEYSNPIDGSPVWRDKPGYWNAQFPKSSKPLYLAPGAQPAPSFAGAYQGAMEDVAIWKKRALEAEDLNRKFIAEINGPMHMGEPAQPAPSEGSITAGILSGMFLSLDGHDKAQPGYEWRKGWNDAIRQAMDYAHPAPNIPDGWLRAIDEALVVAHIGVANESDTFEQAREKLDNLIGFHVDVATDPVVNGGWKLVPIEPMPSMPKLHVGYLPTLNQDGYPALGTWWVQLWDGDDVFARVYGSSPEEAHNRAEMLAAAPEAKP